MRQQCRGSGRRPPAVGIWGQPGRQPANQRRHADCLLRHPGERRQVPHPNGVIVQQPQQVRADRRRHTRFTLVVDREGQQHPGQQCRERGRRPGAARGRDREVDLWPAVDAEQPYPRIGRKSGGAALSQRSTADKISRSRSTSPGPNRSRQRRSTTPAKGRHTSCPPDAGTACSSPTSPTTPATDHRPLSRRDATSGVASGARTRCRTR
jgi:hypothetical protein